MDLALTAHLITSDVTAVRSSLERAEKEGVLSDLRQKTPTAVCFAVRCTLPETALEMCKLLLMHGWSAAETLPQPRVGWLLNDGGGDDAKQALNMLLLEHGSDPKTPPLAIAAEDGNTALVTLLMEHGADVEDGGEVPPLHRAICEGHLGVTNALLDRGADPNRIAEEEGMEATPLCHACRAHWIDEHEIGFELTANKKAGKFVTTLLAHNADVHKVEECKYTPLCCAVERGLSRPVQILLEHGACPNEMAAWDVSFPIHTALSVSLYLPIVDFWRIVGRLLLYGADPMKLDPKKDTAYDAGIRLVREIEFDEDDDFRWLFVFKELFTFEPLAAILHPGFGPKVGLSEGLAREAIHALQMGKLDPDTCDVFFHARTPHEHACPKTLGVVRTAIKGWAPRTHYLHHAAVKKAVEAVLLVTLRAPPTLPHMPLELWLCIMRFFCRRDWPYK